MIKIKGFLLFVLNVNYCFAQDNSTTTTIWTTELNHIVDFSPVHLSDNLHQFYHNKIEKSRGLSDAPNQINKQSYLKNIHPKTYGNEELNWLYSFESNPQLYTDIFNSESVELATTNFTKNKFSFFEVQQKLIYKGNKIYIQNLWMKPLYYAKQKEATRESTQFFTTKDSIQFTQDKTEKKHIPKSAHFITRAYNKIRIERTKTTPTLARLLEQEVMAGNLKAFNTLTSVLPPYSLLNKDSLLFFNNPVLPIEHLDSAGNVTMTKYVIAAIDVDEIEYYLLLQDFYFDFKTEILYSRPIHLILLKTNDATLSDENANNNFWGVSFE